MNQFLRTGLLFLAGLAITYVLSSALQITAERSAQAHVTPFEPPSAAASPFVADRPAQTRSLSSKQVGM